MIGVIDLKNIPDSLEIPISSIVNTCNNTNTSDSDKMFSYEEVEIKDSSASIYYTQNGNKALINIYGPREVKYREKMKSDEGIVEVYLKFNYDISKDSK